jgi:membrane protein YdbS with pleckstrin-like domain
LNEIDDAPPVPAPAPAPAPVPAPEWKPLPAQAATTAMFGGLFGGLVFGIAPAFAAGMGLAVRVLDWTRWQAFLLAAVTWLLAGAFGTLLAYWRWKSSALKLDDTGLRFRRGYVWHKEILVPRSRVQHLDIERGPIERHYGLATLIVHTAGTRHHALRIAGLADADAVGLRDALVPVSAVHDDVL